MKSSNGIFELFLRERQALTQRARARLIENRAHEVMGMEGLPEACLSHILSLTSPQDACRSSAVSVDFQSAAGSDSVWEKFLPSDYKEIISNSVTPVHFSTKKELYATLCQSPILLRGGTKSFQLEKKSGKKCYMLGARELFICWGDTPVFWLAVQLEDKLALEENFPEGNTIYVNTPERPFHEWWEVEVPKESAYVPHQRGDGWMEIQMGEFTVDDNNIHDEVQMRFWEVQLIT